MKRLHFEGLSFFIFGNVFAVRMSCVRSFVFALILSFNMFRLNLAFDNNFHSFQCLHFSFHSTYYFFFSNASIAAAAARGGGYWVYEALLT